MAISKENELGPCMASMFMVCLPYRKPDQGLQHVMSLQDNSYLTSLDLSPIKGYIKYFPGDKKPMEK